MRHAQNEIVSRFESDNLLSLQCQPSGVKLTKEPANESSLQSWRGELVQKRLRRVASVRLGVASPKPDSGASLCLHVGMNADHACLSHCC